MRLVPHNAPNGELRRHAERRAKRTADLQGAVAPSEYSRVLEVLEGSGSAQHGLSQEQRKAPAMPAAVPEGRGNQDARRTAKVQLALRVALLRC